MRVGVRVIVFVEVDVRVFVEVSVTVEVDVRVGVPVLDAVAVGEEDLVGDLEIVKVGSGVIAVADCKSVAVVVAVVVSVAKTPIGTTVGGPPNSDSGVKIDSFQAGGVRISCLIGSTTRSCCFAYSSSGLRLEFTSASTLQRGSMAMADWPAHNISTIPISRISRKIHQSRLSCSV